MLLEVFGIKVEEAIDKFKSILPDYQSLLPINKKISMKTIVLALAVLFTACHQESIITTKVVYSMKSLKGTRRTATNGRYSYSSLYRLFNCQCSIKV